MDIPNNIGVLIRDIRKACGMSQMELADKVGVSYQQIQKYEKATHKISIHRLVQIATALGVPVTDFIGEKAMKAADNKVAYAALSADEQELLGLYRGLSRKKLKQGYVNMLRDIVTVADLAEE